MYNIFICIYMDIRVHVYRYLYLYTGFHSVLKQERGDGLHQSPWTVVLIFQNCSSWAVATAMDFVLLSGLFCVMLYNALGLRSEGILPKPVIKIWFNGVTEITHVDFSGEYAKAQVGFGSQTYVKSFLILTGMRGYWGKKHDRKCVAAFLFFPSSLWSRAVLTYNFETKLFLL